MNRYIKITIFTLVCFCFNINKMYACDEDPIPVMTSDPSAYKLYVALNDTLTFTFGNNSYDPDGGPVTWNWTLYNYSTFEYTYGIEPNSSFVFDPNALGLEPGLYGVDVNVCDNEGNYVNGDDYKYQTGNWCGTRDIFVLGIKYFEDFDENEIHYAPYGAGETFYYSLLPEVEGYYAEKLEWEPDILYLYIKDTSGNTAYLHYSFGFMDEIYLDSSIIWDGLGNRDPYNGLPLPPGNYTATLEVRKQGTIMKKTNLLIVYQPQIKVNIEDSIVNDVSSGLDVSTLVFKLNSVAISHEYLAFEPSYTTIGEDSILTGLEISYFPNASELILFGENTVVVDIDDNVDNYMETLIQTFYLP